MKFLIKDGRCILEKSVIFPIELGFCGTVDHFQENLLIYLNGDLF